MSEINLTPEQKVKYNALMEELKEELELLPVCDGTSLSCSIGNVPYQKIAQKYRERILEIMRNK